MVQDAVLIVGGGQGGFQAAASLRDEGYSGRITIVGDERWLPYQRPPLSKSFLLGKTTREQLLLRQTGFYEARNIEVVLSNRAMKLDRSEHTVTLASGRCLEYSQLILATGARARSLRVSGMELDGVVPLRNLEHALTVRRRIEEGARNVVVVGAGFIGLEVAAVAGALGLTVHVLECADRPLKRAISAVTANFLATAHSKQGVEFHYSTALGEIKGRNDKVVSVVTTEGEELRADLVIIGIGVEPNVELAMQAGLLVDDGIVVDQFLQTADPAISAFGDCARYTTEHYPNSVRLESVQNAVDQARCIAARLVGRPAPYRKVPWFWSDQNAFKLQIAGLASEQDDVVVRGDRQAGRFSVFRFRNGKLSAVESVNQVSDHMLARKLLGTSSSISKTEVCDTSVDLANFLSQPTMT